MGGAMPDMPNYVQVVSSKSFNAKNNIVEFSMRGKPVKTLSVNFLSPQSASTVSGIVDVRVETKNAVSVSITINGVVKSNSTSYLWNTANEFSGNYLLSATAKDRDGNSVTKSITVYIKTIIVVPEPTGDNIITMPPVMTQGPEGSCVAFAVGYAARSVEYKNKTGNTNWQTFSPEHLYNKIKFGEDCNTGTAMQTALEFIMGNGILPWESMPYSSLNGCTDYTTEAQKWEALPYAIEGFFKMYCTDREMIKGMIRLNKPVIITIIADNSFMNAGPGFHWKQYSGSGSLGHSVVICGYDDVKNAWLIMNSWGTAWGDAGYSWIGYELFPTRTGTWCYAIK
jgi:hypothetical protein